ncbi:WD40/YVTN/BNR-like repeat-containing protein [Aquirufa sp. ROCK-SH2]
MMKNVTHIFLILILPIFAFGQWEKISIDSDASFRGLKSYKNNIWASGTKGTAIFSNDKGKNWSILKIKDAENLDFRDICIINQNNILLMSAGLSEKGAAKIFRTKDGGKNWELIFEKSQIGYFFDAIQYDSKTKLGLLVSDPVEGQFQFFTFNEQGENFKSLRINKFPQLLPKEAAFAASGSSLFYKNGIATLITGGAKIARVFQSEKGDLSKWEIKNQEIEADSSSGFFSIGTDGKNKLMIAGGNYLKLNENKIPLLHSKNAGENWNQLGITPNFYIEKVIWSKHNWIFTGPTETAIYNLKTKKWRSLGKSKYHNIIEINGYLIGVGAKGEIGRLKLEKF